MGSISEAQFKHYSPIVMTKPYNVGSTRFWTVARHFGNDREQGKIIYSELRNWADTLIHVVDKFGEFTEEKIQ